MQKELNAQTKKHAENLRQLKESEKETEKKTICEEKWKKEKVIKKMQNSLRKKRAWSFYFPFISNCKPTRKPLHGGGFV